MSDRMEISATEAGVVRVFHLDLPPEAIERFTTQAGTGEWPMPYSLGATKLRDAYVDVVSIRDLADMPLSKYLAEAHGVSGPDFKQARGQLDALRGHVVILPSAAFGGQAQTLSISNPLRWVGTFTEEQSRPASLSKLRSKSAKGTLSSAPPDDEDLADGDGGGRGKLALALGALFVVLLIFFFLAR